jgi:hypothetical protein
MNRLAAAASIAIFCQAQQPNATLIFTAAPVGQPFRAAAGLLPGVFGPAESPSAAGQKPWPHKN